MKFSHSSTSVNQGPRRITVCIQIFFGLSRNSKMKLCDFPGHRVVGLTGYIGVKAMLLNTSSKTDFGLQCEGNEIILFELLQHLKMCKSQDPRISFVFFRKIVESQEFPAVANAHAVLASPCGNSQELLGVLKKF